MAQLLDLNFDVSSKNLAFSELDPTPISLPDEYQEDIVPIRFRALRRISQIEAPLYERLVTTAYPLIISVGTANNVLASQNTWTSSDGGTLLEGSLNYNTAGIAALADGASVIFEIQFGDYRAQFSQTIRKAVRVAASLVTPAGDIALGQLAADRKYVRKEGLAGEGIVLTSPDGTKKGILYWDDDNSLRAEPIS